LKANSSSLSRVSHSSADLFFLPDGSVVVVVAVVVVAVVVVAVVVVVMMEPDRHALCVLQKDFLQLFEGYFDEFS